LSDRDLDKQKTAEARAAMKRGEIPPVLAKAPPELRNQVASEQRSLFTLNIIDTQDEDGDTVEILLDGISYGDVVLSHTGAALTIPLKPHSSARLGIVATRDGGGGGITFGAISSLGEVRTRVMSVGEKEEWVISWK
jgi:hypothetical protein